ncbi:MAG: tetratricopeptide repeat protein [Terriglobales bacterium]|jgi:tetratricopeptide (TPR) repeat protein
MRRCYGIFLLLLWCSFGFADAKTSAQQPAQVGTRAQVPITTSSAQARTDFEAAMQNFEQYRLNETLQFLRAATKADPKFAQAFIMIAKVSKDPTEQAEARQRAKQLAPEVSPGEQLLIRWLAGVQEDNYLPAIAAMNDLLAKYPRDARLAFLAGDWLTLQERYHQAAVVLEHGLRIQPNYPAVLNDLGYTYAFDGDFEKALAAMDRYVALVPDEPNPHDSYGEILRMDGKFDAALEQYRISVRMDPNFGSELGIADTLALMGKEQEAREEYDRAMVFAGNQGDKVQYELQSALTWIREGNHRQAEKALAEVAKHAHAAGLARLEAEAYRVLAMYEPDRRSAMKDLQAAQHVLQEPHELSATDRNEEQARILRVQATRLAEGEDPDSAAQAVSQLEAMAGTSRSQVIQLCYHGAAGATLVAQRKYAEAISHLQEDSADPLSMRLLWRAYHSTGAASDAQTVAAKLATLNVPTVEQALVVPQFRASLVSQARQP